MEAWCRLLGSVVRSGPSETQTNRIFAFSPSKYQHSKPNSPRLTLPMARVSLGIMAVTSQTSISKTSSLAPSGV
ncbi:unnamed protein product [Sphenostylis stenocarpa]|uniref:Uncharacterized protein n=1 Tax=Sphenostylis stenocarpa TaxID=92480 RepID=A0AA86W1U4_9FABA|nr:unnamed protein product [Sphenostylis stenocarpa]